MSIYTHNEEVETDVSTYLGIVSLKSDEIEKTNCHLKKTLR